MYNRLSKLIKYGYFKFNITSILPDKRSTSHILLVKYFFVREWYGCITLFWEREMEWILFYIKITRNRMNSFKYQNNEERNGLLFKRNVNNTVLYQYPKIFNQRYCIIYND